MQLDQLIALNDEIAALSRAGVPLGYGLTELGKDLPRRLGQVTQQLGKRIDSGESIGDVINDEHNEFPALYRAVILAGIRSGNLTAAAEGLASTLRRLAEVRRSVAFAMIYPILVFVLASVLFVFSFGRVFPVMQDALDSFRLNENGWLEFWINLLSGINAWFLVLPLLVLAIAIYWWRRTGHANMGRGRLAAATYAWVPGAGKLVRYGQLATFTDVLSLLVKQRVPLGEALTLAAEATGADGLCTDAKQIRSRIEAGDTSPWASSTPFGMPPLLCWSLAGQVGSVRESQLVSALNRMSASYRRRAEELSHWLRTAFPAMATFFLAGSIALIYCSSFLVPWLSLLARLARQI